MLISLHAKMIQQRIIFAIIALLFTFSLPANANIAVCADGKFSHNCDQLERTEEVSCHTLNPFYNSINCVLSIENGISSFGRITIEEAAIASEFTSNVVVIGEIKDAENAELYKYETVVLVKKDHINGFKGLKGKKLCHPGFGRNYVSRYILNELEEAVLKDTDICTLKVESDTLAEKHIKGLSKYFSSACRPGEWVDDPKMDKILKQRYPKLCELCINGSPNDSCSNTNMNDPFKNAMDCLINGGDVAITTIHEVDQQRDLLNEYGYLCPNQTVLSNINTSCSWTKQPWDLLVANVEAQHKHNISQDLNNWFNFKRAGSYNQVTYENLNTILLENGEKFNLVDSKNISDYLKDFHLQPKTPICGEAINWCVISKTEKEKCSWLKQASFNNGIYPIINCTLAFSTLACVDDIAKNKLDIVTIDSDYHLAAKKLNLIPVAYPKTNINSLKKTLLVVRNNSSLSSFEHFKRKQGCFSEYGNTAWWAWLAAFEKENLLDTECDYNKKVNEFLGASCVPGVRDYLYTTTDNLDKANLCSICSGTSSSKTAITCNADEFNEYYGNNGALKCLNALGDFAVISNNDIDSSNSKNVRVLCKNNTLAAYPGLDVDDDCYLSITYQSEIVIRKDDANLNNIKLLLQSFEKYFGQNHTTPFEIFNEFNQTKDLLFKNSTSGFDFELGPSQHTIEKYLLPFNTSDCVENDQTSAARSIYFIHPLILLSIIYFIH